MVEKFMILVLGITIALILRAMLQDCADIWNGGDNNDDH